MFSSPDEFLLLLNYKGCFQFLSSLENIFKRRSWSVACGFNSLLQATLRKAHQWWAQLHCGHPWHILLRSFTSHYTNLTLDTSTVTHKITLHWKNNTHTACSRLAFSGGGGRLKLYVRTNLTYSFWVKVITRYKFTPSKQPTKHSVAKFCNVHLSGEKTNTYLNKWCLHYDRTSFHIAPSVKKFLAKTQVPAYTTWSFLMSHSLKGLTLNNTPLSSHCHIIAESTAKKLFPLIVTRPYIYSKGAKSELLFTVKTAKFTTGKKCSTCQMR